MKKLILTFLLLFALKMAYGQLSGEYVADFPNKVQYYLSLNNDRQYYLDIMVHVTIGILDRRIISKGAYTIENKSVILTDKVHNFQMKLSIENDSLTMEKSFCFLKNKTFGYWSNSIDMNVVNFLKDYNLESVENERKEYKIKNQILFPLKYGDYFDTMKSGLRVLKYCLTINRDSTYCLYFKDQLNHPYDIDLLISDGKWNRKGVELILNDRSLKHQFFLLIGDRVLISKLLPGDYRSSILKFKKSKIVH